MAVSRVLVPRRAAVTAISLGPTLLPASSSLPGTQMVRAAPRPLFGLAPGGVCHATSVTSGPVRSYRTLSPLPVRPARTRAAIGGLLSAALSVALRRPGVTRHSALRSSDFPPANPFGPASDPYSHAPHGHEIRPKEPDSPSSMWTHKPKEGQSLRKGNRTAHTFPGSRWSKPSPPGQERPLGNLCFGAVPISSDSLLTYTLDLPT